MRYEISEVVKKDQVMELVLLLFLAVIGGSAGALAGMYIFHHKTLHKKFTIGVPLILVIQVMIFICIMENFYR